MKKILIFSFLFLSLVACEKIDKNTQFSISTEASFEVPANTTTQTPIELTAIPLVIDSQIFEDYKTSTDLIDKATIKNIELQIANPQNADFDFLTDIELYIEADNLPKIRIAWRNNMQNDQLQSFNPEYLPDNLSEYIKNNHLKMSLVLLTDEVLQQPVQFKVKTGFYIDAELIGK